MQIWNAKNGAKIGEPISIGKPVTSLAFAEGNELVLVGANDGSAQLWNLESHEAVGLPFNHLGEVTDCLLTSRHLLAITAALDHQARVWDPYFAVPVGPPLTHDDVVCCVISNSDDSLVATGGKDRVAKMWRLPTEIFGDIDSVGATISQITGMEMDDAGVLTVRRQMPRSRQIELIARWHISDLDRTNRNQELSRLNTETAIRHLSDRRWADACALLRKLIEKDPSDLDARSNLAVALMKLGKFQDAVTTLTGILEIQPRDGATRHQRGHAYFSSGDYASALEDFKQVLDQKPQDPHYHNVIAHCYWKRSEHELAIQHFSEYLRLRDEKSKLDPQSVAHDVRTLLGWVRELIDQSPTLAASLLVHANVVQTEAIESDFATDKALAYYQLARIYSLMLELQGNAEKQLFDLSPDELQEICCEKIRLAFENGSNEYARAVTDRDLFAIRNAAYESAKELSEDSYASVLQRLRSISLSPKPTARDLANAGEALQTLREGDPAILAIEVINEYRLGKEISTAKLTSILQSGHLDHILKSSLEILLAIRSAENGNDDLARERFELVLSKLTKEEQALCGVLIDDALTAVSSETSSSKLQR